MKDLAVLILLLCENHFVVWSAAECDKCSPGPEGEPGFPGFPGLPGDPGVKGTPGYNGIPGLKGVRGEKGQVLIDFQRSKGPPGVPGEPGVLGMPGRKGEPGETGATGPPGQMISAADLKSTLNLMSIAGIKGDRGPVGWTGEDGLPGREGARGCLGYPGLNGWEGLRGTSGIDGVKGQKGEPGPRGPPGLPGRQGSRRRRSTAEHLCEGASTILVQHSQSHEVPSCKRFGYTLWEGYSYFATGATPDYLGEFHLGSPASCVLKEPDSQDDRCWLSAQSPLATSLSQSISRCTICQVCSPILVMHSQSGRTPECPENWQEIWNGYSVIQDNLPGSSAFSHSGSCLKKLLKLVDGPTQNCNNYTAKICVHDKTAEDNNVDLKIDRSRCSVCIRTI